MDSHILRKLKDIGALKPLSNGEPAVRVSLQYVPQLRSTSRAQQRDSLSSVFQALARFLRADGAVVDLSTMSPSGQTVEADLPVERFDEIVRGLDGQGIRVDVLTDREVV